MAHPLTPTAAALYLDVSEKTLTKLRRAGKGPEFVRDSHGHVQYSKAALADWRSRHRRTVRYTLIETAERAA